MLKSGIYLSTFIHQSRGIATSSIFDKSQTKLPRVPCVRFIEKITEIVGIGTIIDNAIIADFLLLEYSAIISFCGFRYLDIRAKKHYTRVLVNNKGF